MAAHALLYSATISAVSPGLREEAPHISWFCSNLSHLGPVRRCPVRPHRLRWRHSQCRAVVVGEPEVQWQLFRPSSGRVPTSVPRPVQLGLWVGGKRRPAGQKSERKDQPDLRVRCLSTNRMNSFPDRYANPTLPPAMRELAALCEYSEGSHEANARQRNPGRGVARRTG